MPVSLKCAECGGEFTKSPSQVRQHNFCGKECRTAWFRRYTIEVTNTPGHNKGTKRPHLSQFNRQANRMNTQTGWTPEERRRDRERLLSNPLFPDQGKSYKKFLGRHLHRVIAENSLGRKLKSGEIVHHIDGNKLNNDPENLMVVTREEHARIHFKHR